MNTTNEKSVINVNTKEYNYVINKLRDFCRKKGLCNGCYQQNPTILAACEQPENILPYLFNGETWPMVQTNQMQAECDLLENPDAYKGLYTTTTSYRNEQEIVPGRHSKVFRMFEFELPSANKEFNEETIQQQYADCFEELLQFCEELLRHFGFDQITRLDYEDACKEYNTDEIEHEHEMDMCKKYGGPVLLTMFPPRTFPFWNMATDDRGYSYKCDVIINRETFGTAVRSCDKQQMRHSFETISNGEYAQTLYNHFTEDRVTTELNKFLEYNFIHRFGGGIGITRLISGLKEWGLMPTFD